MSLLPRRRMIQTLIQGLLGGVLLSRLVPTRALADGHDGAAPAALAENGRIEVRPEHLRPVQGRLLAQVDWPSGTDRPVVPVLGDQDGPAHARLRDLVAQGRAAGNHGDLYENRDRGHSRLPAEAHPQLTHIAYASELRARDLDYGPAGPVLFGAPVIGNSSTALTDPVMWRALPRLLLTSTEGPRWLFQNYLSGHIHVYPGHHDHNRRNGDLIPANTPFFLVSHGSSRSDQPHLEALAMILAGLQPDTKAFLIGAGLLAPTVQAIFRRGCIPVARPTLFQTGIAHPSVFNGGNINLAVMLDLAQALTPDTVPPLVMMQVVSEDGAREGVDFFGAGLSETLFDTPVAIARIWRSAAAQRSLVVSAEALGDVPGRGTALEWHLLRGDRTRVRITPLDAQGHQARITLDWQAPMPVPGDDRMRSNRVDIGVFARNAASGLVGMPGLISILLPQHESRRYGPGPEGQLRIESREFHDDPELYVDPVLFPRAAWRDQYHYDAEGRLLGWSRESAAQGAQRFDAEGRLLTDAVPQRMRYPIAQGPDSLPHIQPTLAPDDP